MAALDRAVALAEHEHAVAVADDLDLDVPAVLDVRLDEDGAVAERRPASASAFSISPGRSASVADDPHAAAAAAGGRLDQQGQVGLGRASSASRLASTGTPAASISCLASIFEPIASIASGDGPTQVSPASITARAKSAFSDRKP